MPARGVAFVNRRDPIFRELEALIAQEDAHAPQAEALARRSSTSNLWARAVEIERARALRIEPQRRDGKRVRHQGGGGARRTAPIASG